MLYTSVGLNVHTSELMSGLTLPASEKNDMQVIAMLSQKGGAGKSTLCRQFSALAGEAGPTGIVDLDPQKTASKWWGRRQELEPAPEFPELYTVEDGRLAKTIEAQKGTPGTLFIDTRPAVTALESEAAKVADLVVIPVRPSMDDVEAVGDTIAMLQRLGRRAVIVVNAARNERRATDARAALSRFPVAVCPHHITDRAVYWDASVEGMSVAEMRGSAARDAEAELRRVWAWIEEQAAHA